MWLRKSGQFSVRTHVRKMRQNLRKLRGMSGDLELGDSVGADRDPGYEKAPMKASKNPAGAASGVGGPPSIEADISGQTIADEWDRIREGETSSKYFNLTKPDREKPCSTVTGMGGNLGMASVVHPVERRKTTISELRRISAFPDDFVLVGSSAQQWARLGNAEPPVMMMHIAAAVRDGVLAKISGGTAQE